MSIFTAYIFVFLIAVVAAFQIALAAGMPWGSLAMGGKFPGRFPPYMRVLALIQMVVLLLFGFVVLVRAGIVFPQWLDASKKLIWGIVAFCALSVVANLATPSKWERIVWAPVAIVLLACGLVVAFD